MTQLIIISLITIVVSLFLLLPMELILISTEKIKEKVPTTTKKQGFVIISLAFVLLLIGMRFWYGFWILGIVKNPMID